MFSHGVLILVLSVSYNHCHSWYAATFNETNDQSSATVDRKALSNTIEPERYRLEIAKENISKITKDNASDTVGLKGNTAKSKLLKWKIHQNLFTQEERQKKILESNETASKRFLDVFQVTEFENVPCTASSGLEGICVHEIDCQFSGGIAMGTCADGYGACCVTQISCDQQTAAQMGWFTNPGFPTPSTDRLSCTIGVIKSSDDVAQIRLDFMSFELLPALAGTCESDQFVVSGQNINNIIPTLCGVNTGQHIYIEVSDVKGPLYLSVQTVDNEKRLFAVKISQLTRASDLAAPPGCLQYYREPAGYLQSFNFGDGSEIAIARYPSYLNNLNYAMCIERSPETCGITYANTGKMQIVNYDTDGLPVIPPGQAGVEIFNCPTDWLLISATRLCGERLNDGSIVQDFSLDAPIADSSAGPIVVWFRTDGGYVGRGFKLNYQQNACQT